MMAAGLGCPLRSMLSGFNRISSNWPCVKPPSAHAGNSGKICSICCFYATALLGLNHKQIRRPAITSAFGFLLRIIALGKYKWEYLYIGGFIEGMRRWEILTQMVSWGSVVRCFNFDELVKSRRRALTKTFNWFHWLDWLDWFGEKSVEPCNRGFVKRKCVNR